MKKYLFLIALLLSPAAFATVVLNDTMSRSSRADIPNATGAQWRSVGPATLDKVTYAPNELKINTGTTGAQLVGYLTTTAAPINLAVGNSVTVTFTFALTGGLGSSTTASTLRFGLFNSTGLRITNDITTVSSSSSFIPYAGYTAWFAPVASATGMTLRTRIPNSGLANQNNLIGTTTNVYTGANATGASQALAADVNYTGTLKATRTETGVDFQFSLTGSGLSDYTLAYTDTAASAVITFDTFAAGWANNTFATAEGALIVRSLVVETSTGGTPPPGPVIDPDPTGPTLRPSIWVRYSEKAGIKTKIGAQSWATAANNSLVSRAATRVSSHQADRDTFLRGLPVTWTDATPKFKTMPAYTTAEVRTPAVGLFDFGVDAAVLYYLTGDRKYAQAAADLLHNTVKTLLPVAPAATGSNNGWIIQNDLLLEARVLGTQLPIIYDFLHNFLQANKVYDVQTASEVDFNFADAQQVFRKYYELVRDRGVKDINWSALRSTCMLNNLLALDDATERAAALEVFLNTGSSTQGSLAYDYRHYPTPGSFWPETIQYAADVIRIRASQLVLLERYDPTLQLFQTYPNYALSLTRVRELQYPNGELISFGDGKRTPDGEQAEPFPTYEAVYQHAKARGLNDLVALLGPRINDGVSRGKHNRSTLRSYEALGMHNEILHLLWSADSVPEAAVPFDLARTDALPFAGITLQRNPAPASNSLYGLMGFIGGGEYVHNHASGMSMELYGMGQVLGAKGGRTTYGDVITENYYRVFASNNTIIVNGASKGGNGWTTDIVTNTVQNVALEPAVKQPAVSANHSFSTSTFLDDQGTLAEATQQRTLGIVRTSPTTGYYVDIFRSDSSRANEFHDYIYRNVGDTVTLSADGADLPLVSAPDRFQSDIGDSRQSPGWRYFTNTEVSATTSATVRAVFAASLPAGPTYMQMWMPGAAGREYARVSSPPIVEAPAPYDTANAPTLVIRKTGSAWDQPFAAVYEPYLGSAGNGSVKAVSKLEKSGVVVGLKVESTVGSRNIVQYVISNPGPTDTYTDSALGLSFRGRYAVATDNGDGTGSLYIGEGSTLTFNSYTISSVSGANTQAHLEYVTGQTPVLTANAPVNVSTLQEQTITFAPLADRAFGVAPFAVGATASSGLPVTIELVTGPASLSDGTVTLTGVGTVILRAIQAGNANYHPAPAVQRSFSVLPSFASWQQQYFSPAELAQPAISGPNVVLAGDGVPNLVKYALGLGPRAAATTQLPAVTLNGSELHFTYSRPTSVTDVTYVVETSSNLVNWTPAGVTHELIEQAPTVQQWRARKTLNTGSPTFLRLNVTR